MTVRDRLALAAALAVALAASALVPVFDGLGWLLRVLLAVAVVGAATTLARRARAPRLLEPLAGLVALGLYSSFAFASGTLAAGLLPTGATLTALGDLVGTGLVDVEELAPPVPTNPGLVLLAVLGVGGLAVLVDLVAVTLRQPAVAGLPLLALFAVPAAVLPDGLGWLPFALGAAGWLGLLLADGSDAVSRWGTPLRTGTSRDPSLGRVGRRIGATALGVAVVVPALLPGLDSRLLGGGSGGDGPGGASSTTTYNPILELGGQLRLPEPGRLLLRYTTDDADPDYLRLTTLDDFDEQAGWSSSELSADLQDDAVQDGIPVPLSTTSVPVQPVTTTVDLARLDGPWLPSPLNPRQVDVDGPWLWDEEAQTVFSTRVSLDDVEDEYVVRSEKALPTPELLRDASGVPTSVAETYSVPPVLSPFVAELLEQTTAGLTTDYDRVAAVQQLFRDPANGFTYDEDASVPGFNAPDALENFLRGRRGFCEQYSSAMAALVRALGIPARVAVGFTQGSQAPDGRWEVTTSDAHAWPEVWFSGTGWVRFEPTPRSVQVTTPGYTVAPRPAPETPQASGAPVAPAPAVSAPAAPGALDRGDDLTPTAGSGSDEGLSRTALVALLAVGGLLLLAALPSALAALRRRRRWRSRGPLVAWAQLQDDAVDAGHAFRSADSPRAAATGLAAARGLAGEPLAALQRVAVAAERARYARPSDEPGAEPGTDLSADVRAVRSALLAGLGRRARLLARFAPPSALRWAAGGLGSGVADALDRVDTGLTAAGDRLRRPARRRPV